MSQALWRRQVRDDKEHVDAVNRRARRAPKPDRRNARTLTVGGQEWYAEAAGSLDFGDSTDPNWTSLVNVTASANLLTLPGFNGSWRGTIEGRWTGTYNPGMGDLELVIPPVFTVTGTGLLGGVARDVASFNGFADEWVATIRADVAGGSVLAVGQVLTLFEPEDNTSLSYTIRLRGVPTGA